MENELIIYFNREFNTDLRELIHVYKMNDTRNRRDDNLDHQNVLHNMLLTSHEQAFSVSSLQDQFFSELAQEMQRNQVLFLACHKKMVSIEIQNGVLNLDYPQVRIIWQSEEKKQVTPFKLTHLCAAVIVKNFNKYNVESMGQLQALCAKSGDLKKISFRTGIENSRRAYSFISILKNLIYPKLLLRTIQSDVYYENIRINLKPYCSKCTNYDEYFNLFIKISSNLSYCNCYICNFMEYTFHTVLYEPTGHYKFCNYNQ